MANRSMGLRSTHPFPTQNANNRLSRSCFRRTVHTSLFQVWRNSRSSAAPICFRYLKCWASHQPRNRTPRKFRSFLMVGGVNLLASCSARKLVIAFSKLTELITPAASSPARSSARARRSAIFQFRVFALLRALSRCGQRVPCNHFGHWHPRKLESCC